MTMSSNQEQALLELLDIVRELSSIENDSDVSEILTQIVNKANKVFNADSTVLSLVRKDEQEAEIIASTLGKTVEGLRFPLTSEYKGLTKALLKLNKTKPDLSIKPVKSWLGVPLIASNNVIGVMSLDYHTRTKFSNTQIQLIELFASQAAIALKYIQLINSLPVNDVSAPKYSSCFISYSAKDESFVQKLYNDLEKKRIRCWFAPSDMKIGDKIRSKIDEVITQHDKLLLILSKSSIHSQWVEQEVETALEKERKKNLTMLFPIRLDHKVMKARSGWAKYIRNTRNIGDFSNWSQEEAYQESLNRLLRDLEKKS